MALRLQADAGRKLTRSGQDRDESDPVQLAATPAAREMQAQGPSCDEEFR